MASSTFAQSLGYRSRRSALIPRDVSLSPEEEAVIAARIGYRPVPPPGATESTWFASVTLPPYSQKLQYDEDCHAAQPDAERPVLSSEPEPAKRLGIKQSHKASDSDNTRVSGPYPDDNTRLYHEKTAAITTSTTKSKAASRYRQFSWKIDIPHMSEVQSLSSRARQPAISPTTPSSQSSWTATVRTAMPPRNIDHDQSLMGNFSHRGSSTIEAWGA